MARHEYDYPMTSRGVAAKGFIAGSLFIAAFLFPHPPMQLASFILAVFVTFECCIPFDEYFYFGTVILSGIIGAFLALVSSLLGILLHYWILMILAFLILACKRCFFRWRKKTIN